MEIDLTKKRVQNGLSRRLQGTYDFVTVSRNKNRTISTRSVISGAIRPRQEAIRSSTTSVLTGIHRMYRSMQNTVSRLLFWGRTGFYRVILQTGFIILIAAFFLPYIGGEDVVLGASGAANESLHFEFGGDVLASDVIYEFGSGRVVIPADRPTYGMQKYIVQSGDTLSEVAAMFEVNEDTIVWANNLTSKTLHVGQSLDILPVNGILYTVKKGDTVASLVKKYKLEENGYSGQSIIDTNLQLEEPYSLTVGQQIIIPGAEIEKPVVAKKSGSTSAYKTSSGKVYVPRNPGMFIKPTAGSVGKMSTHFGGGHDGIDIYSDPAPDLVAAAGGKVILAGWKTGGCGNGVIIDHGNGYKTKYCHMEKYYVNVGDSVVQGQRIGKMGHTGRAYGVHVHFCIYYKDVAQNPSNYFKM